MSLSQHAALALDQFKQHQAVEDMVNKHQMDVDNMEMDFVEKHINDAREVLEKHMNENQKQQEGDVFKTDDDSDLGGDIEGVDDYDLGDVGDDYNTRISSILTAKTRADEYLRMYPSTKPGWSAMTRAVSEVKEFFAQHAYEPGVNLDAFKELMRKDVPNTMPEPEWRDFLDGLFSYFTTNYPYNFDAPSLSSDDGEGSDDYYFDDHYYQTFEPYNYYDHEHIDDIDDDGEFSDEYYYDHPPISTHSDDLGSHGHGVTFSEAGLFAGKPPHHHENIWKEEATIGLLAAVGVLFILALVLGVCLIRTKRQLNETRQMASGSLQPQGVVVAMPTNPTPGAGSLMVAVRPLEPVAGVPVSDKIVEEGLHKVEEV